MTSSYEGMPRSCNRVIFDCIDIPSRNRKKWQRLTRDSPYKKQLMLLSRRKGPQRHTLYTPTALRYWRVGRHLRKYRNGLKNQVSNTARAIARYFPKDTKLTAPDGGYILWVELNSKIDSIELYYLAGEDKIFIIPGVITSSTGKYKNCIRISCCHPWDENLEKGIMRLGKIIEMLQNR